MSARASSEAGFSLVETVAAMGILALAAIPLMEVSSEATRNAGRLEARLLSRTVAENVMARTFAEPDALDAGLRTGREEQMGRAFTWMLTIGPAAPGQLQALEVRVTQQDDEQVLARLVSMKEVPVPYVPRALPGEGDEQ